MASPQCHTIEIRERRKQPAAPIKPYSKRTFQASIYVDFELKQEDITIEDPLAFQDREVYSQFLDGVLHDPRWKDRMGRSFFEEIDQHGQTLLAELQLGDSRFDRPIIAITVHDLPDTATEPSTIHELHWEQLERPELWSARYSGSLDTLRITVRRVVESSVYEKTASRAALSKGSVNDPSDVESGRVAPTIEPSINILLVLARKLPTTPDDKYEDVDAWPVIEAISAVQRDLRAKQGIRQLHFEICRPGTFEALTKYLETSRLRFQIVHFDLHGTVERETRTAFLWFNHDRPIHNPPIIPSAANESTRLERHSATDVALLLQKHKVSCAVLNSCNSAASKGGVNANLSRVFAQHGIDNVVAMSYKFPGSASTIFNSAFYKALFLETNSLAEAARCARAALRSNRVRIGKKRRKYQIVDWFVPVVYTRRLDHWFVNEDWQISRLQRSLTSLYVVCIYVYWSIECLFYWIALAAMSTLRSCRVISKAPGTPKVEGALGDFLSVENVLYYHRTLFFHGAAATGKTRFLKYLASLWPTTGFVERVHIKDSQDFLDGEYWNTFRGVTRYIRREVTTYTSTHPLALDQSSGPRPQSVYIIDHIDLLYHPRLLALDAEKRRMIESGRRKLEAFLDEIHDTATHGRSFGPPYVIVAGREKDSGDRLMNSNKHLRGGRIQHRPRENELHR